MTQKDLVVSFHEEGLSAKEIHERLVEIFGGLAMAYSTITRILRETCWTPSEERSQKFGGRAPNFDHDRRILSVLAVIANASLREKAHETRIPKTTVFNILHGRLGYSARKYRFVPHALTEVQRRDRVEKSTALLSMLTKAKRRAWQFIITGDESWFFIRHPIRKYGCRLMLMPLKWRNS
jgi:hypothetical protein